MGRYATREEELDRLLRGRVFVDLYRVVRQALVMGTDSYSLKKLEPLYMAGRTDKIADAASSIVAYERWLSTADPSILDELERYNRTDCESTWRLRDWLEDGRVDAEAQYRASVPRPLMPEEAPPEGVAAHSAEISELVERLTAGIGEPPDASSPAELRAARWLLANLLDWHRREAKPEWWRYFHRVLDCTNDDLFDDTEAVAGLEYDGVAATVKKSYVQ
jgi:RNase_H superfamily